MALKKGLRDLLIADADISALVGTRVSVGRMPQGSDYPRIVLKVVASEYSNELGGVNATQMRRVQFDCWGNTAKEADETAAALHNLLDGYLGVLSEGTTVKSCRPTSDVDLLDEEVQIVGLAVDFNIWFTPANFAVGVPATNLPDVDLDITDEDLDADGD